MEKGQAVLKGKISFKAILRLESGLHIGAASDFAPIGAVDSPFIRDPYTKLPIIPGSSLKGKLRTLLAKSYADGYILNDISQDKPVVQRLFGASNAHEARASRLQFFDLSVTEESIQRFQELDLDTYMGEIKFENGITRTTAVANPRQIERVPAGMEFTFRLVYNVEQPDEADEDIETLARGIRLLQMDYLGGHGSRGYGRVSLHDVRAELFSLQPEAEKSVKQQLEHFVQLLGNRQGL